MGNNTSDRKRIVQKVSVLLNDKLDSYNFTNLMFNISIALLILLYIVSIVSFVQLITSAVFILIVIFIFYKSWVFGQGIGKAIGARLVSNKDSTSNKHPIIDVFSKTWKNFVGEPPQSLINYFTKLKDKNFYKPMGKDIPLFILLLIISTSMLYIPVAVDGVLQQYEQSGYFKNLSDSIVVGDNDDYSKIMSLINWQKSNITNIWGIDKSVGIFYPPNVCLWYAKFPPQICIRPGDSNTANWALISRYGMCGEESQAFMELVSQQNIPVRTIRLVGEDHAFDEVLINGIWKTVDITNGENGSFNIPFGFYEAGWGYTIAYAYAEYPNGTQEVVTNRYTQLSNITISVLDVNEKPVQNATVKVYCNNKNNKQSTDISNNTTALGISSFSLGDGKYIFEVDKGNYTGSGNITLYPNTDSELVIKLDSPIQRNILGVEWLQSNIALTTIFVLITSIFTSYIVMLLAKFLNNKWIYLILFGTLAYTIIDSMAYFVIIIFFI